MVRKRTQLPTPDDVLGLYNRLPTDRDRWACFRRISDDLRHYRIRSRNFLAAGLIKHGHPCETLEDWRRIVAHIAAIEPALAKGRKGRKGKPITPEACRIAFEKSEFCENPSKT